MTDFCFLKASDKSRNLRNASISPLTCWCRITYKKLRFNVLLSHVLSFYVFLCINMTHSLLIIDYQ